MSLILEALRKSEAERRRGQAPDISLELPPTAQRRTPLAGRWVWPTVGVAGGTALLLALLLWRPFASSPDTAVVTPAAAPAAAPATAPPRAAAADPVVDDASQIATATPPVEPDAPAPSPPQVAPADLPIPDQVAAQERALPAAATPPDPRQRATLRDGARSSATPSGSVPPPIAAVAPPESVPVVPDAVPAPAAPRPPSAAWGGAAPSNPERTPMRLADLSADERRLLPPLKISMHMWNPSSTQRFAIVDGTRVSEGDRIGDAVVEAITADAVVLAWNGRRLLLKIR